MGLPIIPEWISLYSFKWHHHCYVCMEESVDLGIFHFKLGSVKGSKSQTLPPPRFIAVAGPQRYCNLPGLWSRDQLFVILSLRTRGFSLSQLGYLAQAACCLILLWMDHGAESHEQKGEQSPEWSTTITRAATTMNEAVGAGTA